MIDLLGQSNKMKVPTIRFVYNRRHTATKNKTAAVEIRIGYNRKAKILGTGIQLLPKEWCNGMVTNRVDAQELNKLLEKMRINVLKVVNEMMDEGRINLDEIGDRLNRLYSEGGKTFLEFCQERIEVRTYGRSKDSKERYERFLRFLEKWGKIRFFSDVTDKNVLAMDAYLKKKSLKDNSKWSNYHRVLNSFILDAVDAGLLKRNPYRWVHINKDKSSKSLHKCLTLDEMKQLQDANMGTECLEKVRDLFVFQTYTCLAYVDMASFDFTKCKDIGAGRKIYTGRRGKTGQEFTFLLLKPAMGVLKKYNFHLPLLSNAKYNEYLKVCAQMACLDKPLTSHWARHTGATILLNEGVDMETVAKILGHSSTRITRSTYAKLLDETIVKKMKDAEDKMLNKDKEDEGNDNKDK